MMWYSVPFIGLKSANFERFKGKYVTDNDSGMGAAVLDPHEIISYFYFNN